jgi:uncharacterized protein (TIGR01777 family)
MNVLITGGSGLIGRELARQLLAAGAQVSILTRSPATPVPGLPSSVARLGWDGRTARGWEDAAAAADAIVNLAGSNLAAGRWTPERKATIQNSRLWAGEAVVAALRAAPPRPRLVVQASAVGYYGPRGDEILSEEAAPGTDFLSRLCVAWEASTAAVADFGARQIILRTGVVLDRDEGALPRMALPTRFFVGGPLGSGRQYLPWIHHADTAAAIRYLLELDGAQGPYNLTAPEPLTNREFSRALGQALGRPSWLPVPAFALRLLFGEMATVILDGQRAVPARLSASGFTFAHAAPVAAIRDVLQGG